MEITHRTLKRVDLVTVNGRVDSSAAPDLAATLRSINDASRFRIVLDMTGLEYISSAGLGVLVTTLKNCRRYNRGNLLLASVPDRIAGVLELAGLAPLFETFPDAVTAVGSF
jgi:anti-sigma B factor antagonist